MSVDFESIALRSRCEASSLKLAAPLLEQGFTPPFLARYRRDELGGIDEDSLWALASAIRADAELEEQREKLRKIWESTPLADPALGTAIRKANSMRMLSRIARRLKTESNSSDSASRLVVRMMNPQKGDPADSGELATKLEPPLEETVSEEAFDETLAHRLAGDPRVIGAAVRWFTKNAKIKVVRISDPHTTEAEKAESTKGKKKAAKKDGGKTEPNKAAESGTEVATDGAAANASPAETVPAETSAEDNAASGLAAPTASSATNAAEETVAAASTPEATTPEATPVAPTEPEAATQEAATPEATPTKEPTVESAESVASANPVEPNANEASSVQPAAATPATEGTATEGTAVEGTAAEATTETTPGATAETNSESNPATNGSAADAAATANATAAATPDVGFKPQPKSEKADNQKTKKTLKKLSPRQRRRKWMVSILKHLAGKKLDTNKLSNFQTVMLARALRSQVAECEFLYDANQLVIELQKAVENINRSNAERLRNVLIQNEASIREAAELAWWDDLQERASAALVRTTADQLRREVARGGVEASVVLSIDAVGPKLAASTVVASDGRILHSEDLPCGLGKGPRAAAVSRMGELVHRYRCDLIVISNGSSRRSMMIALSELIAQSPPDSIRYTLAERSGADAYAGSDLGDLEMRSTPRRFRAAAWLAFSILQPSQALAKVDPIKLRLNAFGRELSESTLTKSLEEIIVSGASRGGVDVNSTPVSWLSRLPGMNADIAKAIDKHRKESLFASRQQITDGGFLNPNSSDRQALPFLRVFNSEEPLDGTLIHPDDYRIANRLAKTLEIELPPASPPGYTPPDYTKETKAANEADLVDSTPAPEPAPVEDFTESSKDSPEFKVDTAEAAETETNAAGSESTEETAASAEANSTSASESTEGAEATDSKELAGESETEKPADASADSPDESTASEPVAEAETKSEAEGSDAEAQSSDGAADATAEGDSAEESKAIRRPRPDSKAIDKCVKEWQIGAKRAHQIVHWLCDPFGDGDISGEPRAVAKKIPTTKDLKPGDQVVGVVVGMMPFGVFVELAPDCSGLVHVSRLSEDYVEDIHEVVSVGDIVTAYVTGMDEKHRRVSLSLISPSREVELEKEREEKRQNRFGGRGKGGRDFGGKGRGQRGGGAGARGNDRAGQQGGDRPSGGGGGQRNAGQRNEGQRGGPARSGDRRPAGGGDKGSRGAGDKRGRGGRDNRSGGGNRGNRSRDGRGKRGERKLESYRVESKIEAAPLSEDMKEGKEPMRSFGDLAQFLKKEIPDTPAAKPKKEKPPKQETQNQEATPSSDAAPVASNPVPSNEASPATNDGSTATPSNEPVANSSGDAGNVVSPSETLATDSGVKKESSVTSETEQA